MKTKLKLKLITICCLLSVICGSAFAQGTAFTYQGRLNSSGSAASGNYDFRFRLDADPLGNTILATASTNAVPVTNGLFITTIDFGAGWFNGSNYWLEVDVRTNGAASYVGLTPLQPLLPTPYAIMANSASNLLGALPAVQLSGTLQNSSLPTSPVFSGAVTANSFSGNGANVTGVNAASLGGLIPANFWQTGGNSGTMAGANFIGTTDNQPLELHINGVRGFRLEPTVNGDTINVIGGSPYNTVAAGKFGAAIGGGGANGQINQVTANFATVSGGKQNTAGGGGQNTAGDTATVGGGSDNIASAIEATIGGGVHNRVTNGASATVAGGNANVASGYRAAIGGGEQNTASGQWSAVPGGLRNAAGGDYSFAAGQNAQATNQGAFVWADTQNGNFSSTNNNSFNVRAQGGARFVTGGAGLTIDGQNVLTTGSFIPASQLPDGLGGSGNTVNGITATVAGGTGNTVNANFGTVGGGANNTNSGFAATVSGGEDNLASGGDATVGGGDNNTASGISAMVAGGFNNTASGNYSLAAGHDAQAINDGAFVWADTQFANFSSTNNDSFNVRAQGGARFVTGGAGMTVDGSLTIAGVSQYNSGLKLTGSTANGTGLAIENTASGGHKFDLISGGASSVEGAGAFELYDETVGGFRITVSPTGNVGIGTTAPATALQVNGVVTATSFVGAIAPADLPGGLGGSGNTVSGPQATVAGGLANAATNNYATVSGGTGNTAGGYASTVVGGDNNVATGTTATVSGDHNTASGLYSFAAGHLAQATNDGAFVWADSTVGNFASTNNNSFNVRAAGGARFVTFGKGMTVDGTVVANGVSLTSDRNAKENFTAVNAQTVLAKVSSLPMTEWNYKTDSQGVQHLGPMAQDFQAAFSLNGGDDKHISVIDEGGVALAAIQGLNQKLQAALTRQAAENAKLKQQNDSLAEQLSELEATVKLLAAQKGGAQ